MKESYVSEGVSLVGASGPMEEQVGALASIVVPSRFLSIFVEGRDDNSHLVSEILPQIKSASTPPNYPLKRF